MFFPEFIQFNSVQLLSHVRLFATPWITALQASLSITNSWSLLKLMPIKLVMPSSHLILCRPLLLLPSIPPSIRVFSNESALRVTWPKYWSFSFSISPSNEHPEFIREKQKSTFPNDPWPQQQCLVNSRMYCSWTARGWVCIPFVRALHGSIWKTVFPVLLTWHFHSLHFHWLLAILFEYQVDCLNFLPIQFV